MGLCMLDHWIVAQGWQVGRGVVGWCGYQVPTQGCPVGRANCNSELIPSLGYNGQGVCFKPSLRTGGN